MKITLKALAANGQIEKSLVKAVVKQLGGWDSFKESAKDIVNHGIDGGFHGFIYYVDTVKFYKANKKTIIALAKSQASELGQGMFEMIKGFKCMADIEATEDEIAESMYTCKGECVDQILNCLAWYAGEEVSRLYVDLCEQED